MRVHKYIPDKYYGFAIDPTLDKQVFFHLVTFNPGEIQTPSPTRCSKCPIPGCTWPDTDPPPILGEPVMVELAGGADKMGKAPKAKRVTRVQAPHPMMGHVDTFDAHRGYGFIAGDDGVPYHLHRSEVLDGKLPYQGRTVMFFAGIRMDRPRACHVKVCPWQT